MLNVSLAAGSTDSWQTDPLCAAVRSAAASGITVSEGMYPSLVKTVPTLSLQSSLSGMTALDTGTTSTTSTLQFTSGTQLGE